MDAPIMLSVALAILTALLQVNLLQGHDETEIKTISGSQLHSVVGSHEFVIAFFYTDDCDKCTETLPELDRIVEASLTPGLHIVKINNKETAAEYGVTTFPRLVYFRKAYPLLFDASVISGDDVVVWMEQNSEISTKTLHDDSFEHLTQASTGATTGDWLVLFYEPSCSSLFGTVEAVATRLKYKMNIARVDVSTNTELKKRFKIKDCPTVIFFRHGKQYTYDLGEKSVQSLVAFAEGWYKNVKAVPVRAPPTAFDNIVESIALVLKTHLNGPYRNIILGSVGGTVLLLMVACLCCLKSSKTKTQKLH